MARTRRRKKNEISKIKVTKIRNLIIASVIAICLIIIYKFNFMTKSEITDIIGISFLEMDSEDSKSMDLEIFEDETGKDYIVLPEKVNGYYANKFFVDTVSEIEETKIENNSETKNPLTFIPSQNIIVQNNIIDNQNVIDANSNTNTNTNTSSSNTITKQNTNTSNTQIENVKKELTENNVDVNKISTTNKSTKKNIAISETKAIKGIVKESATSNSSDFVNNEDEKINKEQTENNISNISNSINENSNSNEIVNNVNDQSHSEDNENTSNYIDENNENVNNNDNQESSIEEDNNTDIKIDNKQNKLPLPVINNEPLEIDITSAVPGERFYLPEEFKLYDDNSETKSYKKISIKVEYQTKEINGVKLYNQELLANLQNSILKLNGYIPKDYSLDITEIGNQKIEEYILDEEEFEGSEVLVSYDIKIRNGESEYQPEDYYQNVNVSVTSGIEFEGKINNQAIGVIHIKETPDEIILEKVTIASKTEDTVEFITNEFSEYAIITYSSVTASTVRIEDYESDYNYYMGKNYTDNNSGSNQNLYTDDNLAKVTINYYSYDYGFVKPSTPSLALTKNGWSNSNTTKVNDTLYTSEVTLIVKSTDNRFIDLNSPWAMTFSAPEGFLDGETKNRNTDVFSTLVYENNNVTVTGSSFANWTEISATTYSLNFTVAFSSNKTATDPTTFNFNATEKQLIGYVGASEERQTLFSYTKCIPISGGKVSFELIDNPYMDRPKGTGFDGWTTRETGYEFSLNNNTKVQTLSVNTNGSKNIEINLYPNWKEANVIFVNTVSGVNNTNNNYGLSLNNQVKTWANVNTLLGDNAKTATTASNRELNIVVFTGGTLDSLTTINGKACTITSLYDGIDYRNDATLNYKANVTLTNDLQLDYLKMIGYRSATNSSSYYYNDGNNDLQFYLVGNTNNVRIGRGMIVASDNQATITQVQGGRYGNNAVKQEYRLVIESGKYSSIIIR